MSFVVDITPSTEKVGGKEMVWVTWVRSLVGTVQKEPQGVVGGGGDEFLI